MRQDEFNGIILNKTKTKKRHLDATDEQDSINKKIKKKTSISQRTFRHLVSDPI